MAALAVKTLLRRATRSLSGAAIAATLLGCGDLLGGDSHLARVVLAPQFSQRDAEIYASLQSFNLAVSSLHVVLVRPNSTDIVAETTVDIDEGQDSILVSLEAPIRGSEERLVANLEMSSGGIIVFQGSVAVIARIGASVATAAPILVPVWVGPGATATRVVISPRDQTLPITGRLTFSAAAFDANNQPVTDPEFVSRFKWKLNDATLGNLPVGGGEFVPANKAGTAIISVLTPNLLRDTVRINLVTQLPLARVRFARQLEVIDVGAASTVAANALDPNNAPVANATFTYVSRSPNVATVSGSGAITGVSKGQSVIVVTAQQPGNTSIFQDSLLAVVADPGAPVLISSLNSFDLGLNQTVTVAVFMDLRTSTKKLGSTTVDVTWNPAQLQFQSFGNPSGGVQPTVNATAASTGSLTLAMADVTGFAGRVELLKITFKTSSSASTGQLSLAAREITTADFIDLLSSLVPVVQPLAVH